MTLTIALFLMSASGAARQDAQAEYLRYLAAFDSAQAVTGAMIASGGPVGQPSVAVFRVARGGKYAVYRANQESHSDGKTEYTYAPEGNKYLVAKVPAGNFAILFGRHFDSTGAEIPTAVDVRDAEFQGRKAKAFRFAAKPNSGPFELYVRQDKPLPLGIVSYGQQAQYTLSIPEIHVDRKPCDASFDWSPPKGAAKSDSIRG